MRVGICAHSCLQTAYIIGTEEEVASNSMKFRAAQKHKVSVLSEEFVHESIKQGWIVDHTPYLIWSRDVAIEEEKKQKQLKSSRSKVGMVRVCERANMRMNLSVFFFHHPLTLFFQSSYQTP